ncbi:uncharacterized protein K452DRAFT_293491 [Aplosporella prunicola CBS 121167]|uniref:Class II aldolase/adducin N-terminal domain-containing protein n=1 Tax=Aplosporella prunicola CBS 121167 TaxID=1176127 RepID=A0A6A6BVV7_9PEZI|nr:uncharacterized protein K452DRAFT_293491 [Aplosporella prunicola CBS 121167]KAF2146997.1 hypothetical protein K452DRAFT_293491 [Aplosporella prunicola CBS 121167]
MHFRHSSGAVGLLTGLSVSLAAAQLQNQTLRETFSDFIDANHILDYYKLVDGFGQISLRNPEDPSTVYATGNLAAALVRDFDDIGLWSVEDGSPVSGNTAIRPEFQEIYAHTALMRAYPGIQCVVTAQAPPLVARSNSHDTLRPLTNRAAFLGKHVPIFEFEDYYREEDGRQLFINNQYLGDALAALFNGTRANGKNFVYDDKEELDRDEYYRDEYYRDEYYRDGKHRDEDYRDEDYYRDGKHRDEDYRDEDYYRDGKHRDENYRDEYYRDEDYRDEDYRDEDYRDEDYRDEGYRDEDYYRDGKHRDENYRNQDFRNEDFDRRYRTSHTDEAPPPYRSGFPRTRFQNGYEFTNSTGSTNGTNTNTSKDVPPVTVVLERNRGIVTHGTSIRSCVYRAVWSLINHQIQEEAELISATEGGPGPRFLSRREIADAQKISDLGYIKEWPLWKAQVDANPLYHNDLE